MNELIAENIDKEYLLRSMKTLRVSSLMLKLITEAVPDEKIIEIGERLANDALERNLPFEVAGDLSTRVDFEDYEVLRRRTFIQYTETEHEGKKVVILAHYVGRSYSLLIATYWKTLLASIGQVTSSSTDDGAIVMKFDKLSS